MSIKFVQSYREIVGGVSLNFELVFDLPFSPLVNGQIMSQDCKGSHVQHTQTSANNLLYLYMYMYVLCTVL